MSNWSDETVAEAALRVLRERVGAPESWSATLLGVWDARLPYEREPGERPLLTFYAGPDCWTLHSTRRMVGVLDGEAFHVAPRDVADVRWGPQPPKGAPHGVALQGPGVATFTLGDGSQVRVAFERGDAWAAVAELVLFWRLKAPALDTLAG